MIWRRRIRTASATFVALLMATSALAQQAPPEPLAGLDTYIENALREWRVPGLAIAVVKGDTIVYAQGFGVREMGKPEPVTPETRFAMASNSKAFTATAIGLLVEEKRLGWDDAVCEKLPAFQLQDPAATRALTIRDLLCHRVGLGTWQGDLIWYGSDRSIREVLERVRELPPDFGFRDRYAYCNLTFLAAGELLGTVTGETWASFVEGRLFRPLAMTRSSTSIRALEGVQDVAKPHTLIGGEIAVVPYRNLDNCGPAGGINSCVLDWSQWMRAQLNDGMLGDVRVIPSSVIRETHAPQNLVRPTSASQKTLFPSSHFFAYGLGWFMQDYLGRLVLSHGGGMDGMLSLTVLVPEEKLGVVVLTNFDEQELYRAIPFRVVDAFLKAEARDWSGELRLRRQEREAPSNERVAKAPEDAFTPRPTLDLTRYTGSYRNGALGEARIEMVDGTLKLAVERNPGLRAVLTPRNGDLFEAAWADPFFKSSPVPFRIDGTGRPAEFRFSVRPDFVDPMEYIFTREP